MIEVIGSTVFRCFFAAEPVSVHSLVVGHKIDYCKYRTCFDLSKRMHQSSFTSHKNKGHSPFFFPPIMRSSVGQCRNIRFRQLSASHVIITSVYGFLQCSPADYI